MVTTVEGSMGKTIRPRLSRKLLALLAMGVFAVIVAAGTAFALGAFRAPYAYDDPLAGGEPMEPLAEYGAGG